MELGISMFGDNHFDAEGKAQPTGRRLLEFDRRDQTAWMNWVSISLALANITVPIMLYRFLEIVSSCGFTVTSTIKLAVP